MIWHSSSMDEIAEQVQTNLQNGLSEAVAHIRYKDIGDNFSPTSSVLPFYKKLIVQFKRPANIVLLICSLVFLLIELLMPAFGKEYISMSLCIIIITLVCCVLRAVKSYTCEKFIANEQKRIAPKATVIRAGKEKTIDSSSVVIGDIIVLKCGYCVPADARLIESDMLTCNEASVTGVSAPVVKDSSFICTDITPITQRSNMVYSGSWITHGKGLAVVVEVGDETELGKRISIQRRPALTDINSDLNGIKKALKQIVPVIAAIIFVILSFILRFTGNGDNLALLSIAVYSLLIASVIIAALSPDRITGVSSLITAIGMFRLKLKHVTVTNSDLIPKLSRVNCICVDKNALTTNEMSVVQLFNGSEMIDLRSNITSDTALTLRLVAAACDPDGDTTDMALIKACKDYAGISKSEIDNLYPQLSGISFDRDNMLSVSVNMIEGQPYAIIKGAVETIIKRCDMDEESIILHADAMGVQALHVIAVAIKQLSSVSDTVNPSKDELESGLSFLGLIGISDPIRTESRKAVIECADAGIKVLMFTGDSLSTAKAVARQTGILVDDAQAVSGSDLDKMTESEFEENITGFTTFARVTPDQRIKILQCLKNKGNIIAATGNSPEMCSAMDTADIGCAMAKNSSDVVKRSADVIIEDNSFKSVINMIKGGRNIIVNIRNSIHASLCINISAIIVLLFGFFIWQTAIVPISFMLLSILSIDFIAAFIIAFEPYTALKKIDKKFRINHCFESGQKTDIAWQCVVIALFPIIIYALCKTCSVEVKNIAALLSFCTSSVIAVFGIRTRASLFNAGIIKNLVCLITLSVITIALIIYAARIGIGYVLPILIFTSFIPMIAIEIGKLIRIKFIKEK